MDRMNDKKKQKMPKGVKLVPMNKKQFERFRKGEQEHMIIKALEVEADKKKYANVHGCKYKIQTFFFAVIIFTIIFLIIYYTGG